MLVRGKRNAMGTDSDGRVDADAQTLHPLGQAARWLLIASLAAGAASFAMLTRHWMMVGDSPIMHYVIFLMSHGLKPYSQITDNNLPGSYITEWLAMHVFGSGDLGWRLYEFFLLAALASAMALIARPYDWAAGVFGAGVFLLLHGKEGVWLAVEREQVMTVLLMIGYAALFVSVRRRAPAWMLAAGFFLAFAASIKPTVAPLSPVLLLMAAIVLHRRGLRWLPYVALALTGMFAAAAVDVGYLLAHEAWGNFLYTQRVITPYYVGLAHLPLQQMIARLLPGFPLLLVLSGTVLAVARLGERNARWTWEQWALLAGAAVGLASYFQQHKGFLHHRYLFVTFLLLLVGIELMRALRQPGWRLWLGAVAVLAVALVYVPWSLHAVARAKPDSDVTLGMMADLDHLAGGLMGGNAALQGRVQCLDLVYGCFNALYHERLVENTGFMGDLIIFDPADSEARREHRATWARLARRDPADVLLISNEFFQGENGYGRIANWPLYARYLAANYRLLAERSFPKETTPASIDPRVEHGYRVYVRRLGPEEASSLPPQVPVP